MKTKRIQSIAILQPVVPDYRVPLFEGLKKYFGEKLNVYAGRTNENGTINSTDLGTQLTIELLKNKFILNGNFLIQLGSKDSLETADLLIANYSLRHLSTIFLLWKRRKQEGKFSVFWGHATGQNRFADSARKKLLSLADGFIAYTKTDAEFIQALVPDMPVWHTNNSCVWKYNCRVSGDDTTRFTDVIYVGRLIEEKKVKLLIDGFAICKRQSSLPEESKLHIVGSGPEIADIKIKIKELGLETSVNLHGHISDPDALDGLYKSAFCSGSPGYVGLSCIQSFARGVPMVIGRSEPHSPEIESCIEGFNSEYFKSDDAEDLARILAKMYSGKYQDFEVRKGISKHLSETYTYERMLECFKEVSRYFGNG